jgi:hypothetical protein
MTRGGAFRKGLVIASVAVVGLASSPARADEGSDTITLKSGGIVRGSVMEYDPSTGARVKLADGSVRSIEADRIAGVTMGSRSAPAAAPEAPQGPTGQLHVDAPAEIEIVGRPNDGYEWAPICQSPCDRTVHLDWEYSARGPGVRSSSPFQLYGSEGQRVAIAVDPASSTWFVLGIVGAIGGANVTIAGLYIMLVGSLVNSIGDNTAGEMTVQTQSGGIVAVGAVVTAVGAVLLVGGGIAALSNWSTHVSQGSSKDALPLRLPTWRTASFSEGPLPTAYGAPLVNLRF